MRVPVRLVVALVGLAAAVALVAPSLASAWTWPVDGPVLVPFSFGSDPYAAGQHRGIDIGSPTGTPVVAAAGGTVTFAGTVPNGGKTVTIQTPTGYAVTLVHLGSIGVSRDAEVAEGATVGTVGPSGVPDIAEPYVYLGIRVAADDQGYVDPLLFLPPRPGPPVPAAGGDPAPAATDGAAGDSAPAAGETPSAEPPADGASTATTPTGEAAAPGDSAAAPVSDDGASANAGSTDASSDAAADPSSAPAPPVSSAPPAHAHGQAGQTPPVSSEPGDAPAADVPQADSPPATDVAPAPAGQPQTSASADGGVTTDEPAPEGQDSAPSESWARPALPEPALPKATPGAPLAPESLSRSRKHVSTPSGSSSAAVAHRDVSSTSSARISRPHNSAVGEERPLQLSRGRRPELNAARAAPAAQVAAARPDERARGLGSQSLVAAGSTAFAAVAAFALAAVLRRRRRSPRPGAAPAGAETARIMVLLGGAEAEADPGSAGLALRGGPSAPGSRDGLRGPGRHLRPLSPAAWERPPDGQRDRRARDAGDGRGGQRRRLAA